MSTTDTEHSDFATHPKAMHIQTIHYQTTKDGQRVSITGCNNYHIGSNHNVMKRTFRSAQDVQYHRGLFAEKGHVEG